MSVYPVLETESLNERCQKDIAQFMSEQGIQENPNPQELLTAFSTKQEIQAKIEQLKPKFGEGVDVKYVDAISHVEDPAKKQQLWIARTYLVYQLLIVLTLSLQTKGLYDDIFLSEATKGILASLDLGDATMFMDDFRQDVALLLQFIKLGIFGSLTPTSDIDIGFQYSGLSGVYTPCLAYIVSRFEMLFLIFTRKTCLDFDVESYADMITVPNPDPATQLASPDLFYLDTGKLTWEDPSTQPRLLPIAFNSIVRNVMIGLGIEQEFNLSGVISQFEDGDTPPELTRLKEDQAANTVFETSKQTISAFLSKPYNEQIQAYYVAVNDAEQLKVTTLRGKTTIAQLRELTNENIINLIFAIGQALTLRMESYTCSPTVLHVVRVLQAEAQIKAKEAASASSGAGSAVERFTGKYVTTTPSDICDLEQKLATPKCIVGKTGFILSALEQIGYMYRFHKTYCEGGAHPDTAKCKKKMDKYKIRLDHAIANLRSAQGGGKRVNRRTYMKHAFMKSSSRYNEKPKTKKHRFKTVKKHHAKLYKKYRNSKKMKRAYMKKTVRGI